MTGDQIVVAILVVCFAGFIVYLAIRSRREEHAAKATSAGSTPVQTPKAVVPTAQESSKPPLRKVS